LDHGWVVFGAVEDFRLHRKPELPDIFFRDLSKICFRGWGTDVDKGKPGVSDWASFGFGSSLCSASVFGFFNFWSNFSSHEATMRRLLVVRFLRFDPPLSKRSEEDGSREATEEVAAKVDIIKKIQFGDSTPGTQLLFESGIMDRFTERLCQRKTER
jgi:hypothetical protein